MLIKALFLLSLSAAVLVQGQESSGQLYGEIPGKCRTISVRKEIRQMSPQEIEGWLSAIQQLKTLEIYDRFSDIHNSYVPFAHGTPAFFPWHRYFIRLYEYALQSVAPEVVIPYWDWSLDSQAPEQSFIFKIIGGNGKGPDNCIEDGPFANWTLTVPLPHCLTRNFNGEKGRILALWSPESIKFVRESYENYGPFCARFEEGPHGVMHQAINGEMVNFFSPNDPVFYLHHGFVDKNWALWQANAPQNYRDYSGTNTIGGTQARDTDMMVPFGVPVRAMFDHSGPGLCSIYSNSPSDELRQVDFTRPQDWSGAAADVGKVASNPFKPLSYQEKFGGPDLNDRDHQKNLRIPFGLSSEWAGMMFLNVTEVRELESINAEYVNGLNDQGYISPVCLSQLQSSVERCKEIGKSYKSAYEDDKRPDHQIYPCDKAFPTCAFIPIMEESLRTGIPVGEIEARANKASVANPDGNGLARVAGAYMSSSVDYY
ncbi:hypothetical protein K7432_009508 [Basidiobolus ranarum]|uniref:Tyrosinase copper-binding domain-containing protein n=1 Tax=Basidiobolus ranarum TaxID=34480 RepID=A0ABR2VWZ1_9FUNG